MKKNFLQDVIPPTQKRSIRDIPLPNNRNSYGYQEPKEDVKPKPASDGVYTEKTVTPPKPPTPPIDYSQKYYEFEDDENKKFFSWKIWVLLFVVLTGIILLLNRSSAEIVLSPKQQDVYVANTYSIYDHSIQKTEGQLGYKLIEVEKTVSEIVEPSGEEQVSLKASGIIKIVNNNSVDKTLISNTRFETPNGSIYRISNSIKVPANSSLEAEVFADNPGEEYNISKTNFTIPGFKDFPELFSTIYAEGVTDMSGGYEGIKKIVSEEDKDRTLDLLKNKISEEIRSELNESSKDFIVVLGEDNTNYSNLKENDKEEGVELTLSATGFAYAFSTKDLARFLADNLIIGSPEGKVDLLNPDDLKLEITETELQSGDSTEEEILQTALKIEGNAQIEWVIDEEKIKSELTKKTKNEFKEIMSNYPQITTAKVDIKPWWRNKFPKESEIEIIIEK